MRVTKKSALTALAVTSVVALSGGAAFAYWTTTGSGPGSAGVGTNMAIGVVQTSIVSGLGPGSPAQGLAGTFDNPNTYPVTIGGLSASVTGTGVAGCSAADFVVGGTAVFAASAAVDDTSTWSGLNVSMTNTAANQNACKNATLTIAYVVTVAP
jgi:hypothetical protein